MRFIVFVVNTIARVGDWYITRFSERIGGEEEGSVGRALAEFTLIFLGFVAVLAALAFFPGGGN